MTYASFACHSCSADLQPAECSVHQRHFHSGQELHTCCDCLFASSELSQILTHCLLEGHSTADCSKRPVNLALLNTNSEELTVLFLPGNKSHERTCNDDSFEVELKAEESFQGISLDSIHPEKAFLESEQKITIQCSKCSIMLTTTQSKQFSTAKRHVRCCYTIRQYACSSCKHMPRNKWELKDHIKLVCPNACAERVDPNLYAKMEEEGLSICFPCIKPRKRVINEKSKTLQCANCRSVIQSKAKCHMTQNANRHVCSCLKIRPYGCSKCGYKSSQKNQVLMHIRQEQSSCSDAQLELVDRERSEKAVRDGILLCFPDSGMQFKGLCF